MFEISTISKAIAAGVISAVVGVAAKYGFHPSNEVITASGVLVTALVSYIVGHVFVYFAPKNKV